MLQKKEVKINKKAINLTPEDKKLSNINSLSQTPSKANIQYWATKHLNLEDLLECVINKMAGNENLILNHNDKIDITYHALREIYGCLMKEKTLQHSVTCDNLSRLKKEKFI